MKHDQGVTRQYIRMSARSRSISEKWLAISFQLINWQLTYGQMLAMGIQVYKASLMGNSIMDTDFENAETWQFHDHASWFIEHRAKKSPTPSIK